MFNDELHTMTLSEDGSYTAYSKEYDEHYHSTKDGALHESLVKHVIPAFSFFKEKNELYILDICYGLGFNTLATIYYCIQNNLQMKLHIFSPELDASLVRSLKDFAYPKEFESLYDIAIQLAEKQEYKNEDIQIEIFLGDAREYIKKFPKEYFDIVYQDAFSPSSNPILWTQEYFSDIAKIMKKEAVLTTYSTALRIRLALHNNKFNIYVHEGQGFRSATVASLSNIENLKCIDMKHKIACNPNVKAFLDSEVM